MCRRLSVAGGGGGRMVNKGWRCLLSPSGCAHFRGQRSGCVLRRCFASVSSWVPSPLSCFIINALLRVVAKKTDLGVLKMPVTFLRSSSLLLLCRERGLQTLQCMSSSDVPCLAPVPRHQSPLSGHLYLSSGDTTCFCCLSLFLMGATGKKLFYFQSSPCNKAEFPYAHLDFPAVLSVFWRPTGYFC